MLQIRASSSVEVPAQGSVSHPNGGRLPRARKGVRSLGLQGSSSGVILGPFSSSGQEEKPL